MYVSSEALRNLSRFAAWASENSEDQVALASNSALLYALEHGSKIVESAIQLHGGIGFTWEHPLHLFLRRCKWYEAAYAVELSDIEAQLVGSVRK
jgi:alkylation response protein AidB-like acyl-CoA dehydrogenase